MNEKTKTVNVATGSVLYRATYTYAAKNGQLRTGAIIIEAKDATEAFEAAAKRVETFGLAHARVTHAKPY